jgi:dipeptide/tripeptide permease
VLAHVSGYHVAFGAAAVMLAAGALIMVLALRPRDVRAIELSPAPAVS